MAMLYESLSSLEKVLHYHDKIKTLSISELLEFSNKREQGTDLSIFDLENEAVLLAMPDEEVDVSVDEMDSDRSVNLHETTQFSKNSAITGGTILK